MAMIRLASIAVAVAIGLVSLCGCNRPLLGPVSADSPAETPSTPKDWWWSQCLQENVRQGRVHYARLSANPVLLDRLLLSLAAGDEPNDHGAERTARLINTFNIFAMRAGLERYRADQADPNRARAPKEDEYLFRWNGRDVSLSGVRARLMGGKTPDVRILFGLCPARADVPLPAQPFESDALDQQLQTVAAEAMSNPDLVLVDHENMRLSVANVIGRHRRVLIRWYQRRTNAKNATLLNALMDLADDAGRDRLNTAVGYRLLVRSPQRRLNLYVPTGSE